VVHLKSRCNSLVMMILAILFLSVLSRLPRISSAGRVIRVPEDYSTIQGAVNAAALESVILVSSGVYQENLVINKTLRLIGQDKTNTVIDGNGKWTVVEIIVDNVVLNGFTIQNSSRSQGAGGVLLNNSDQCNISDNVVISNAPAGLTIWNNSNDNLIEGNIMAFNGIILPGWIEGRNIAVVDSNSNTIVRNFLSDPVVSNIELVNADCTVIQFNSIQKSGNGLYLSTSNNSVVHHNIFSNNWYQLIVSSDSYDNTWDDGVEGNYWDDYVGIDDGNNSRIAGDGVGDTDLPHAGFDELGSFLGLDKYPLVRPPTPIQYLVDNTAYSVAIDSNSTVSRPRFVQTDKKITFNVTGPEATAGHCNLTIPKSLLRDSPWKILLNGIDITSESTVTMNETHSFLYFTYDHHRNITNIQISGTWVVHEFHPNVILTLIPLFMTLAVFLRRRRIRTRPIDPSVRARAGIVSDQFGTNTVKILDRNGIERVFEAAMKGDTKQARDFLLY